MKRMQIVQYQLSEQGGRTGDLETELGPLLEFYQMCRRYGLAFFEEYPGNTVYHLVLEERTLLFTFSRKKNRCSVSYLAYPKHQMAEAWLQVIEDVERLRRDAGKEEDRVTEGGMCFAQNLETLKADVHRSLKPFSFIVSCLPEECFPQADHLRLYNAAHVGSVKPEEILVPLHRGDAEAKAFAEYQQMRETLLSESSRPSRKSDWELFRTDEKGRRAFRKVAEPVRLDGGTGRMRVSDVEDAFSRLWEK